VRLLLFLIASSFLYVNAAQAQTAGKSKDESAVRELVSVYAQAREQRDAKRLASILAPDADQLVSSGEWRRGRDELVRGMLQSSESNSGSRTLDVETVRFITPGVALADARYEIAGSGGGPSRRMWSLFIASKINGAWKIQGIRNMLPASGR
jgi:uncharacterized protein (TIGR02246 family)